MTPQPLALSIILFAALSAYYALKTIQTKNNHAPWIRTPLTLIACGFLLWTLGELIRHAVDAPYLAAEINWILGYLLVLPAFAFIAARVANKTALLTFTSATIIACAWIVYLITRGHFSTELAIESFYPLLSGTLLIITINLHEHARHLKTTALAFLFLSLTFFSDLIADFLYLYTLTVPTALDVVIASNSLYAVGYFTTAIAFYLLSRS